MVDELHVLQCGVALCRIGKGRILGWKDINVGLLYPEGTHTPDCLLQVTAVSPLLARQEIAILQTGISLIEYILIDHSFSNQRGLEVAQLHPLLK